MSNIPIAIRVLGLFILTAAVVAFFIQPYRPEVFAFIIICFALAALAMNYKKDDSERNAWDVWFFTAPGIIVALLFVGILGEASDPEIWKWVASALGAVGGIESLSAFVKEFRK